MFLSRGGSALLLANVGAVVQGMALSSLGEARGSVAIVVIMIAKTGHAGISSSVLGKKGWWCSVESDQCRGEAVLC